MSAEKYRAEEPRPRAASDGSEELRKDKPGGTEKPGSAASERRASGAAQAAPDLAQMQTDDKDVVAEAMKKKNEHDKYKPFGPAGRVAKHPVFENGTLLIISINACWIGVSTDRNHAETIETATAPFQIGENFFCIYFTGEVLIRFMAYHTKCNFYKDGWFVFDSILVSFMVIETWILPLAMGGGGGGLGSLSVLRLLRLLRLTRMVRLMRAFPDLLILVRGMVAATRSVASTLGLLVAFLYVFAILFTTQVGHSLSPGWCKDVLHAPGGHWAKDWKGEDVWDPGETPIPGCGVNRTHGACLPGATQYYRMSTFLDAAGEEHEFQDTCYMYWQYGDMPKTMLTLFLGGTLLDDVGSVFTDLMAADVVMESVRNKTTGEMVDVPVLMENRINEKLEISTTRVAFAWVMILFILISAFTVLNMLIGVLCEVVSKTSDNERNKAKVIDVMNKLHDIYYEEIDEDGTGRIDREEFNMMADKGEVQNILNDQLGIETQHLISMGDKLFAPDPTWVWKIGEDGKAHGSNNRRKPPPGFAEEKWDWENAQEVTVDGQFVGVDREFDPGSLHKSLSEGQKPEFVVELDFADFVAVVCDLRPENPASVMDLAELQQLVRQELREVETGVEDASDLVIKCGLVGGAPHRPPRKPLRSRDAMRDLIEAAKCLRADAEQCSQEADKAEKRALRAEKRARLLESILAEKQKS